MGFDKNSKTVDTRNKTEMNFVVVVVAVVVVVEAALLRCLKLWSSNFLQLRTIGHLSGKKMKDGPVEEMTEIM